MAGVGGDHAGEQDGEMCFWGGLGIILQVDRGKGCADCSLENFTIMSMLKEVRQFALLWS